MLQIVHDLAPGALLYYATAFNSDTDFANNIRALGGLPVAAPPNGIVAGGVNIIIDDVSYSNESGLHDGQPAPSVANIAGIVQAVNDVAAAGVLYFSSAANSGNKVDGTSGTWEGDFVDGGTMLPPPIAAGGETGNVHIWSGAAILNPLTAATNDITMQWSDPSGNTCNDYDMFLLNAAGTALVAGAFSVNTQDCTPGQDPFEEIFTGATFPAGSNIVVVLFSGSPRFLSMSTQRGQTTFNTAGATRGHNAPATGFGVAATPAAAAFGPPTPDGPFPGPFVSTNEIEEFSSDGPRQSFFDAAGNPYTPGNFLHTGGTIRQKPDFTAADGVGTTLPGSTGLNPFYGTSAAAPHAGAIAALVKQAAPVATNAQIATFLTSTALDIMAPGSDAGSGVGILQAFQAVSAAKGGVGLPVFDPGTITVTRVPSAGPLFPGDSATMLVQITNNGASTGTGVSAVLTTSTPCITITGNTSAYPDTAVGASNTNTTPFAFSLSPACVCPVTINFTLTVTFAGGSSVINFQYVTGPPPVVINGDFNSTPVVPGGYAYSTGTQSTRLSRNFAGTCAAPKAFPGTAGGVLTRRYDAYTFTTGNASPSYCVNVTLDYPNYDGATFQVQSTRVYRRLQSGQSRDQLRRRFGPELHHTELFVHGAGKHRGDDHRQRSRRQRGLRSVYADHRRFVRPFVRGARSGDDEVGSRHRRGRDADDVHVQRHQQRRRCGQRIGDGHAAGGNDIRLLHPAGRMGKRDATGRRHGNRDGHQCAPRGRRHGKLLAGRCGERVGCQRHGHLQHGNGDDERCGLEPGE